VARYRLQEQGWECGYGIHKAGDSIWGGLGNAFLVGEAIAAAHMKPVASGVFEDPAAFIATPEYRLTHVIHSNLKVLSLRKVIRSLRDEAMSGTPKSY